MNRAKKFQPDAELGNSFLVHPKLFVFFDKKTGIRRFEVEADQDGRMPMEQAVNLLAIQCVARQQMPSDFGILIGVGKDLVDGLVGRVASLMQSCSTGKMRVPLSRRQREVMNGIAQNQTNKEIASMLNISTRTIKFHVSVLLAKFKVHSRMDLMLEATTLVSPGAIQNRDQNHSLGHPARCRLLIPADNGATGS
jgi:DNA-binding CsgD family transcriptional regulator